MHQNRTFINPVVNFPFQTFHLRLSIHFEVLFSLPRTFLTFRPVNRGFFGHRRLPGLFREIQKFLFSGLNCYFGRKITIRITNPDINYCGVFWFLPYSRFSDFTTILPCSRVYSTANFTLQPDFTLCPIFWFYPRFTLYSRFSNFTPISPYSRFYRFYR